MVFGPFKFLDVPLFVIEQKRVNIAVLLLQIIQENNRIQTTA